MAGIVIKETLVRRARVKSRRTQRGAIAGTGCVQHINHRIVGSMPKGEAGVVEVEFLKLDLSDRTGFISNDDLETELGLLGFKLVDPISLAAVNEATPSFANDYPNATYWKDGQNKWCYIIFNRWQGSPSVHVGHSVNLLSDKYWFAVVSN